MLRMTLAGEVAATFKDNTASNNGVQSIGNTDFSDGFDRIMIATCNGSTNDVNVYVAKTTDANITEISYAFQDSVNGTGYAGASTTPKALTSGAAFSGTQDLESGEEVGIVRIWKGVVLTPTQVQEVFESIVAPNTAPTGSYNSVVQRS